MKEKTVQTTDPEMKVGSWKMFFAFFKKVKLSWMWILISLVITIGYYVVVTRIPGSTAALYSGQFSSAAIMGLIVNYLCMLVLSLATSVSQLIAQTRSTRSIRNSVWETMMNIQTGYFDKNDPAAALSAVTNDAQATSEALVSAMITVPALVVYLAMCLSQVALYSKKLLAMLFVLVPVYILYALLMGRWQYKTGRSIQMRIGGLTGFLTERIRNLSLIKSFSTEKKEEARGAETAELLYKANVQYQYMNGVVGGYTMLTEAVGITVAVIWGSALLRSGEIGLEAWLAFFLFVPMVNNVLRQISMLWTSIKDVQGRASRMGALVSAPQEDGNTAGAEEIPHADISFENVSFRYVPEKAALSRVTFSIPCGKTTAIVGASGSGKTTVLKLLERLYTPDEGTISASGVPVGQLNLSQWRGEMSYVAQDALLFSGTIRECLTYGIERAISDEELTQATKLAGVYDYVSQQTERFDAQMAIWGSAMSGGQRQRLVIARELLRKANVLLLDEPTSALDAETAAAVADTIFARFQGKTVVTVTHELNFITQADQIVVLDQGSIVGCGTHEELMDTCPIYRSLVEEQSYQEVFA